MAEGKASMLRVTGGNEFYFFCPISAFAVYK
jgi:hypothetical protein